ncbi:MAG TPA: VWA domain-containing protein [Bryobacteraceae bacterium]|nr:VWA domain-containing protein [Bryobacteraceae bacterium]
MRSHGLLAVLGSLWLASLAVAQPPRKATPLDARIRIDKEVVLVPVTVCDRFNHAMTGLAKEHFRLFADKVEQTVTGLWADDAPLAIGLVFDTSGSMEHKLDRSRLAVAAFLKEANPEDEFFLVEFNDRPSISVPLTSDSSEIQNRLALTAPHGKTALMDAVYLALDEIKKSKKSRKALLIISDGGDNYSRYRAGEIRGLVRESDVQIYGIGIYETQGAHAMLPEEIYGPTLLAELAEMTGGRHFPIDHLRDLPDVAAKIGVELRNRYVLAFSPTTTQRDGRYHHLQVKLVPPPAAPPLHAYWRAGFYAPSE